MLVSIFEYVMVYLLCISHGKRVDRLRKVYLDSSNLPVVYFDTSILTQTL